MNPRHTVAGGGEHNFMKTKRRGYRPPKTAPRTAMQIVVSFRFLGPTLFAILSGRYDANTMHWAFATAGMILGYWLRR